MKWVRTPPNIPTSGLLKFLLCSNIVSLTSFHEFACFDEEEKVNFKFIY